MEENKKNDVYLLLFIISIIIIIIMGTLLIFSKNKINNLNQKVSSLTLENDETESLKNDIKEKEELVNEINSDREELIEEINYQSTLNKSNSSQTIYSISNSNKKNLINDVKYSLNVGNGMSQFSINGNNVTFSYWGNSTSSLNSGKQLKDLCDYLQIDCPSTTDYTYSVDVKGLSKRVMDITIGCIGQDDTNALFIFLLEDGTLEYSTLKNILKDGSIIGKVDNLNNIVKVQYVSEWAPNDGGTLSMIAIDKNNIAYDLNKYIPLDKIK